MEVETGPVVSPEFRVWGVYPGFCSYCHANPRGRVSYGTECSIIGIGDYQELTDRAFVRSGNILYQPCSDVSCCIQYNFRVNALESKPSKSQRRVLKRMKKYTGGNIVVVPEKQKDSSQKQEFLELYGARGESIVQGVGQLVCTAVRKAIKSLESRAGRLLSQSLAAGKNSEDQGETACHLIMDSEILELVHSTSCMWKCHGDYEPSEEQWQFEFVNLANELAQLLHKCGLEVTPRELFGDTLDFVSILALPPGAVKETRGTQVREGEEGDLTLIVAVLSHKENQKGSKETPAETETLCTSIHDHKEDSDKEKHRTIAREGGLQEINKTERRMVVTFESCKFTLEKYAIYKKFQMIRHKEEEHEVTHKSFREFLCTTPVVSEPVIYVDESGIPRTASGRPAPPCGYGSFHMMYRINGTLIAVGVVDVLPRSLNCNYFIYDPAYEHLSIGVWSALTEIEWVKNASTLAPDLRYYYMGYYVDNCPKMNYKAAFKPGELLCPEAYVWYPLNEVKGKISHGAYCPLAPPEVVDHRRIKLQIPDLACARVDSEQTGEETNHAKNDQLVKKLMEMRIRSIAGDVQLAEDLPGFFQGIILPKVAQWIERAGQKATHAILSFNEF